MFDLVGTLAIELIRLTLCEIHHARGIPFFIDCIMADSVQIQSDHARR